MVRYDAQGRADYEVFTHDNGWLTTGESDLLNQYDWAGQTVNTMPPDAL